VKARSFIEAQRRRADTLFQQIDAAQEDTATAPVQQLLSGLSQQLEQQREQIDRWLEKTRDRHPNWDKVIQGALSMRDHIAGAANQWENREAFLLQLDALLLLQKKHKDALSEEATEALSALYEEVRVATSTLWWTEDGWTELIDTLDHRTSAMRALSDWWEGLKQDKRRQRFMGKTEEHPWLASPKEPSLDHVGHRFRTEVLGPIRKFRQAMERAEGIIAPLVQDAHEVEAGDLRRTLGRLQRGGFLDISTLKDVDAPLQKLTQLEAITGGAAPEEVAAVGCWPNDSSYLRTALQDLARNGADYELDDTEHGVIITRHA